MAKRLRKTTAPAIQRRIKEGRGVGEGNEYSPWLTIHDVASQGRVHRLTGWTTDREHHFLSDLELHYFFLFDWLPQVVDIREQYPLLPRDDTITIAQELGIAHPTDPITKEAIVMTTDFLLSIDGREGQVRKAVSIKPAVELQKPRVIEKLEIERLYWESAGVAWCIGTERDLDIVFVKNIELLHDYHQLPDASLTADEIAAITAELTQRISQENPLRKITAASDTVFGLNPGTSLTVAYHLMATRQWQIDMHIPINPGKPIILVSNHISHRESSSDEYGMPEAA